MNAIEVKNLCKIYNQNKPNEFHALKNINLTVKSGDLVILFNMLFLIFVFSVIPFLAFVIIPSWRIAVSDMSEAVK